MDPETASSWAGIRGDYRSHALAPLLASAVIIQNRRYRLQHVCSFLHPRQCLHPASQAKTGKFCGQASLKSEGALVRRRGGQGGQVEWVQAVGTIHGAHRRNLTLPFPSR
jgi:hypothetical protein